MAVRFTDGDLSTRSPEVKMSNTPDAPTPSDAPQSGPTRHVRWVQWAAVAGNVAVVATLLMLIVEVRGNSELIERQAALDRYSRIVEPYLVTDGIADTYARIKSQDGAEEPHVRALMDRYELSATEAVRWVRHLELIWAGLEADYRYRGTSELLERQMRALLQYPDQRLFWESRPDDGGEFAARVTRIMDGAR
jgi:hypothetical protein